MLSKKTKYAIKALVMLGKSMAEPPLQIARIAEEEKIPKKFLEQILLDLRNAGFLYSKKGAGGGYSLNKDPKDIYLVEILRITDGPIAMVPCASLKFYHKCDECHDEVTCGIRKAFIEVRDASLKVLSETSIADIIEKEKFPTISMYFIYICQINK
jgi:Rrf2 family protein